MSANSSVYEAYMARVRTCHKCGKAPAEGKKSFPGYDRETGKRLPPFAWNSKKLRIEHVVGVCWDCAPKPKPPQGSRPTSESPIRTRDEWLIAEWRGLSDWCLQAYGVKLEDAIAEAFVRRNLGWGEAVKIEGV